jgi:signal transduction histidine kinase
MSLAGRVSAFFLVALGLALAGSSLAIFVLARNDLNGRLDRTLASALDTLTAAAEVEHRRIHWEPADRRIALGIDPGPDQVRWFVLDGDTGRGVDRSANADFAAFPPGWRVARRVLEDPSVRREGRMGYHSLAFVVGASTEPVASALRSLARNLAITSATLWLLSAIAGRWYCRRALSPLNRLAVAARDLDPSEPGWTLPDPATGDELGALAAAFNDLLGRLREAFERQSRFAGDASHQLRTPLTAMIGQIEVALRRERPAGDYRVALAHARDQAGRLSRIVEAMLFLARRDAEAAGPGREPLDLSSWADDYVESHRKEGRPRASDLVRRTTGTCPAEAHSALLTQLVDNLVDNASKWSEPRSPIVIATRSEPGWSILEVEDCGSGIAPPDLAHIFDPFFRSADSRRAGVPGLGLGLAVARRISEALGGSISATSQPGAGSRFTVRLPGGSR